jgi:hypothetical protein
MMLLSAKDAEWEPSERYFKVALVPEDTELGSSNSAAPAWVTVHRRR